MSLIDAIKLYSHTLQVIGDPIEGRRIAYTKLREQGVLHSVCDAIEHSISNHGEIVGDGGMRYAITQLPTS